MVAIMFDLFQGFGFWAFADVAIIAALIYNLLLLLRGTRTMQMVTGIIMIIATVFVFSQFYPLNTLKWLMDRLYSSLIIILVILFQDDLRRVLMGMGRKSILPSPDTFSTRVFFEEICKAASSLASSRIGALIVFERHIILNRYVDIGTPIDAKISNEILLAIFHPTSPIHDGAVIIQQGRIAAAGCFLPLSRDESIDPELGTRHRAALGISQDTDAVVVLVSEERASVSLVVGNQMRTNIPMSTLKKALRELLLPKEKQRRNFIESTSSGLADFYRKNIRSSSKEELK